MTDPLRINKSEEIAKLHQACHDGFYDDKSVSALDRFQTRAGLWNESGLLLEAVGHKREDWHERVHYFKRAVNRFYHAEQMAACVICHRRAIESLPRDLPPDKRLDVWCPAGLAFAYPYVGAEDEALSHVDQLAETVDQWSIYGRFVLHGVRINIFKGLKEWENVINEAQAFVQWAKSIPEGDPLINRGAPDIETDSYHDLCGELGRWYCIIGAHSEKIAKTQKMIGSDPSDTFEYLKYALESFGTICKAKLENAKDHSIDSDVAKEAELYRKRLAICYNKVAEAATDAGRYEEALDYFDQEKAIRGSLDAYGPLYRAAALIGSGSEEEARRFLSQVSGSLITSGRGLKKLEEIEELRTRKMDPQFAEIFQTWK